MALYLFYLLAGLGLFSFLVGMVLAFQPVFVSPVENVRINKLNDKHDAGIHMAFSISAAIVPLLPLLLILNFRYEIGSIINNNVYILIGFCVVFLVFLIGITIHWSVPILLVGMSVFHLYNEAIRFAKRRVSKEFASRRSIRLFHCQTCRESLEKINSIADFLNEKEQIALQLGETLFEAWYCQHCYTETDRDLIHLRRYVDSPFDFQFCSDCDEYTRTVRHVEPSENPSGRRISVYTCQSCNKVEEYIWRNP
jgi:hypothetical protein